MKRAPQAIFLLADEALILLLVWVITTLLNIYLPIWLWLSLSTTLVLASVITYRALSSIENRPAIGPESLIGKEGISETDLTPKGLVHVGGETWSAESKTGTIKQGQRVIVSEVRGLKLIVEREGERTVPARVNE